HHIAALGAEGNLDRVVKGFDAFQHTVAGICTEQDVFCGHDGRSFELNVRRTSSVQVIMPRTSLSFMIRRSSPSSLTSVPDHLPNRILSPALTSMVIRSPFSSRAPVPTATTSPS